MTKMLNFKFVNETRPTPHWRSSPTEKARESAIATIAVQKELLKADHLGVAHGLTKTVTFADENGQTVRKVIPRKPRAWFWKDAKGEYLIEMLYAGQHVVLNGKGNSVILAGDYDATVKVLDSLAEAIAKGELDKQLADAAAKRKTGKKAK